MRIGWILAAVVASSGVVAAAAGGDAPASPKANGAARAVDVAQASNARAGGPARDEAPPSTQDMRAGAAAPAPADATAMAAAHGGSRRAVEAGGVPRATGDSARTVAEIYAQAAALEGKSVRVAARVVRAMPNVLGRTWLHVQDGSGAETDGDFDLVVTTAATPKPGDFVVLEGTVARDRDLGAGYRYAVLVEQAKVEELSGHQ